MSKYCDLACSGSRSDSACGSASAQGRTQNGEWFASKPPTKFGIGVEYFGKALHPVAEHLISSQRLFGRRRGGYPPSENVLEMFVGPAQAAWVSIVNWVIPYIGVEVELILIADRIVLRSSRSCCRWRWHRGRWAYGYQSRSRNIFDIHDKIWFPRS